MVAMNTVTGSSQWDVFLEINLIQKTLTFYTSWVYWKNQCRSTVRTHPLLWNKHEYQHSGERYLLKISLTHFLALAFLYTFWNISENQGFLIFSGGIEREQCHKWAKSKGSSIYDVHKKWPIFCPPFPHHPQKWTIDLLFQNNRICKHVTNFKTPLPPFHVDVINVWSLISYSGIYLFTYLSNWR